MKTRLFKTILPLALALIALPMMGQDYMNVYFKDGTIRKFYLKNVMEISTSMLDVDGVQHADYDYQHVTTIHNKYVYSLEDVDSVTFTKIDEEKAEQNFVSAMPVVFSVIDDCETIADVESRIDEIKNAEGVAGAWSDGHQLYVSIAEGEVYSFHYNHDTSIEDAAVRDASEQARVLIDKMRNTVGERYTGIKAVIANQQNYDENRESYITDYYAPLKEAFEKCGFRADYVTDPDVDFFYDKCSTPTNAEHLNIYDYDIIFLITHGSYGDKRYLDEENNEWGNYGLKGHSIVTSDVLIEIPKDNAIDWVNAYQTIHTWRNNHNYNDATDLEIAIGFTSEKKNDIWYHVGHPSLSEYFFSNIAAGTFTNPNSIMFNTACQSLMGENEGEHSFSFAEQLTKRNLGVYIGYDESNEEGKKAGYHLFNSMLNGMSLHQACSTLSEEERHDNMDEDGRQFIANLRIYPDNNPEALKLFLYPPYTEPVDNKTVTSSYEANKYVEVVGYTTTLDPKVLTYGFEYDTNALFTSPKQATHVKYKVIKESGNKDNVQFNGRLTELAPNQIYYFRAYTYDGENYNYGLNQYIKYGEVLNLTLSTDAVALSPGDQGIVEITSGNGVYDIDNSKETVASVRLEGNKVIIDALSPGKTFITITDTKSTQSTAITVTVWTKLTVAIIGNVDLEIGESVNSRIFGNGDYASESSDPQVATASIVGEFVSVEALSAGTSTITVTDNKTGQTASFTVTVTDSTPVDIPAAAVDLGLPSGTLWANKNVGAASPENGGLYFAWGEIVGYGSDVNDGRLFDWDSYKWDNFTKYCSASWVAELGMGIVDNKTVLDPEDDAATANWGDNWRMPTHEEFKELLEYTTNYETSWNGENGRVYKSLTNDNSIFLPYTGYRADDFVQEGWANYWSSTQVADKPDLAYELTVDAGHTQCGTDSRVRGFLVRPVFCGSGGQLPTYDNLKLSTYDPITMNVNAGLTFMILSGSGSYAVGSSKESVATATLRDNYVDVSGVGVGTATITVIDTNTGQKKTREVTVLDNTLPDTPAEAIDLGLPSGTLWASFNVGATKPEEYGGYYSWGEIVEKDKYEWSDYLYCDGSINTCKELGMDIAGTQYDIAHVKWGGDWCMPTYDQQQELVNNTKFKYITLNGIKGYELVGPNGNSIFLPASGIIQGNSPNVGSLGGYWSSTRDPEDPNYACNLLFRNTGSYEVFYYRCIGLSVRPVISRSQQSVPNLVLESTDPLNLKARQKTGINIISGSGSYTVKSDDESVATADISDWVSLETGEKGKCVNVNAVGVGTTTVTVTDVQSFQQVSITVTVTQNVDLLKLSVSSLELKVGETGDVVITSSSGAQYLVATSDASVATFSVDKTTNTIKVFAVGVGTCNVTVNDSETGETATVEIEVVKKPIDPNTSGWENLISNSDMEGSDVSCFFERTGTYEKDPYPATISDGVGKNGSRGIKVAATARKEENYDNQFWFRMNKPVSAGTKYRFSFDYRADKKASVDMEMHSEPGEYITYNSSWGLECTSGWKTYTVEGIVSSSESPEGNPLRSVAFDLSTFSAANNYYFDNIKFEVAESSAGEDGSFTVYGVKFNMIPVQGGTYMMGADDDDSEASEVERPRHEVTVNDFAIGQTEVTQRLWKAVMDNNPSNFVGDDLPVENITWDQCQTFISKLNALGLTNGVFRLPTEAEWEFAARGGNKSKGYAYSGSNSVGDVAWYGGSTTHPVGQKDCNELGLYDMSGNVWEWCHDWYDEEYYASSPKNNPTGPSSGEFHVRRGGRWDHTTKCCRVSSRNDGLSEGESNYDGSGFRLALVK